MTATNKNIPGKRLKTWHRGQGRTIPLRQFARNIIAQPSGDSRTEMERETARKWAGGKVAS